MQEGLRGMRKVVVTPITFDKDVFMKALGITGKLYTGTQRTDRSRSQVKVETREGVTYTWAMREFLIKAGLQRYDSIERIATGRRKVIVYAEKITEE
jgi:hypothetical protein